MKPCFSLTYKSFPELSDLPRGKAERHFFFAAREFYSSLDGFKAFGLILLCALLGLALGFHFGPLASAVAVGSGLYVGCVFFNSLMKQAISSTLQRDRAKLSRGNGPTAASANPSSQLKGSRPGGKPSSSGAARRS